MKKMMIAAAMLVVATGASAATSSGTLTVTGTVESAINLTRYSHSKTNDGGHGFRLSARGSAGAFYASAYADRQQNVPTIDVIFSERPDLALALDELGISATSAADIVRALRQHVELADLGFIEGITIDLAPMRTQFGLEVAWLGRSEARHQVRARLVRSVVESVSRRTASTLGTLSYSRRLSSSADLFASYSYWRTERRDANSFR